VHFEADCGDVVHVRFKLVEAAVILSEEKKSVIISVDSSNREA